MTDTERLAERLEHQGNARGSPIHFLLVAVGALFVYASLAITP